MTANNPYQAYTNDSILNSNPLALVVALYEGAIESCAEAKKCLACQDIQGRTKAVRKAINILAELLRSLDDEKGGDVSRNLRPLYSYIIGRVTDAHCRQQAAPLDEAVKLLSTLLDGWKEASQSSQAAPLTAGLAGRREIESRSEHALAEAEAPYGGYFPESGEFRPYAAYSF